MKDPILLPGGGFSSYVAPRVPPPRSSRWLRLLIIGWLLVGFGFFLVKAVPGGRQPDQPAIVPAKPPAQAINNEDVLFHMEVINERFQDAAQKIRRAEDQIARTLPAIDRNYLLVERQHLNSAVALTETARRDLEQGRQQADLVVNSIQKEHEQ